MLKKILNIMEFIYLKKKIKLRIANVTIIVHTNKLLTNCLNFELDFKKLGKTKIKTNTKKRAGINSSNPIF